MFGKNSSKIESILKLGFQIIGITNGYVILHLLLKKIYFKINLFNVIDLNFSLINLILYLFFLILLLIICHFSFRYLHKEIGFNKFFLNLTLFWLGIFLFIFENESLILFAGWELIGVSSIFLISFYSYRSSPIKNSLFVMMFYKFADILLITSLLIIKHRLDFKLDNIYFEYATYGIIFAGLIKSASFPFSIWLPKSMEGPTTSSAIYYVSLATSVGILLIIKFFPIIQSTPIGTNLLLGFGILTVLFSSFQSRVQSDIKTILAYSSVAQLGIILIEISFGFIEFALIHLIINSFYKTYQFIKSPSLLYHYHKMVGENGKEFSNTGIFYLNFFPKFLRKKLYFYSLNQFYLSSFYKIIGQLIFKFSIYSEQVFYPLINKQKKNTYKTLFWLLYYVCIVILISKEGIKLDLTYFYLIPILIFFVSLPLLFEKNSNSFIAIFMFYKILESTIVHSVHSHEPLKQIGIIILGIFLFLVIRFEKNHFKSHFSKKLSSVMLIILMLYFTNFPFLLQSLVNEHIIEAFLQTHNYIELSFYCIANTILNIGLYNFIFNKVYLSEAINE